MRRHLLWLGVLLGLSSLLALNSRQELTIDGIRPGMTREQVMRTIAARGLTVLHDDQKQLWCGRLVDEEIMVERVGNRIPDCGIINRGKRADYLYALPRGASLTDDGIRIEEGQKLTTVTQVLGASDPGGFRISRPVRTGIYFTGERVERVEGECLSQGERTLFDVWSTLADLQSQFGIPSQVGDDASVRYDALQLKADLRKGRVVRVVLEH
jgi:hypothetical protein